jgi:hypothetical protein
MTTLSSKSGSIYDTLYVSKVKKDTSVLRPLNVALNLYDASQKKSGQFGNDRRAYMPQQCDKIESHED